MSGAGIVKILINGMEEAAGPMARILDDADLMDGFMASLRDGDYAEFLARNGADDLLTNPTFARMMGNLSGNMDDVARLGTQLGDSSVATSQIVDDLAEIVGREFVTEGTEAALRTGVEGFRSGLSAFDASAQRIAEAQYRATQYGTRAAVAGADDAINASARLASLERWRNFQYAMVAAGLTVPVAWYAYGQADERSGGAVTNALIDGAVDTITSTYDNLRDMDRETLSAAIHRLQSVVDLVAVDTDGVALQTLAVRSAMDSNPDNAELAGKNAALGFQITRWVPLAATTAIRAAIVADVHPEWGQDERDRYLAEGFVDDLIDGANRSSSLLEEGITREEVGTYLVENPQVFAMIPSENIRNGLIQMYPELASEAERQARVEAVATFVEETALNEITRIGNLDAAPESFGTIIPDRTTDIRAALESGNNVLAAQMTYSLITRMEVADRLNGGDMGVAPDLAELKTQLEARMHEAGIEFYPGGQDMVDSLNTTVAQIDALKGVLPDSFDAKIDAISPALSAAIAENDTITAADLSHRLLTELETDLEAAIEAGTFEDTGDTLAEIRRIRTELETDATEAGFRVGADRRAIPGTSFFGLITGDSTDAEVSEMFRLASLNMDNLNLNMQDQIQFGIRSTLASIAIGLGSIINMFNENAGNSLIAFGMNQQRLALTSTQVDERLAALPRDQVVTQGGDQFRIAEADPEAAPVVSAS